MAAFPAWLAAVEAMLDRGLRESAQAVAVSRRLEGTALDIEVQGLMRLRASVCSGRLALEPLNGAAGGPLTASSAAQAPAAATISGSPVALLQLARGSRIPGGRIPGGRFPGGSAVQIRGDAEIGNAYRELLTLARPDLEEELSRIIGDLPARGLADVARKAFSWAGQVRRTTGENIAEYLQEESRDLVNKTELDEFLRGVDTLRETADRIGARLSNLEQRLKGPR